MKYLRLLILPAILLPLWVFSRPAQAATAGTWTAPVPALQAVNPVTASLASYLPDCTPLTFHLADRPAGDTANGCFVSTAAGLLDANSNYIIPKGSVDGMPLHIASGAEAFSVVPYEDSIVAYQGSNAAGGVYLYPYTGVSLHLSVTYDANNHRIATIPGPSLAPITDGHGSLLGGNATALAFSAHGEWLVTESPMHALVRVPMSGGTPTYFAPAFTPYGAAHNASMAITQSGQFVAVAGGSPAAFTVYDLSHCTAAGSDALAKDPLAPESCAHYDFRPFLESKIPDLTYLSQVTFVTDSLLSFTAHRADGTAEKYVLSPTGTITSLIPYLGLGDSYASGEGADGYRPSTDTSTDDCHLSPNSYPLRLNADIFGGSGNSVACSGARIRDLMSTDSSYAGQVKGGLPQSSIPTPQRAAYLSNFTPGYLSQDDFVTAYQPGVITVQIGGNDAGFSSIITRCLMPGDCFSTYQERYELEQSINQIYPKWLALFRQLQARSPLSRIYAVGYPQIISTAGKCGLNTPLSQPETVFAQQLVTYLNSVLQQAATASSVRYIDISRALDGHQLCDGNTITPGVHGVTAGNDIFHVIGTESFHPTALGHELIEQAILSATHNLRDTASPTEVSAAMPTIADADLLLAGMPKSGAAIQNTLYADVSSSVGAPAIFTTANGNSIFISSDFGFAPNTPYALTLAGDTAYGHYASSFFTIGADGSANLSVSISSKLAERGLQPLLISGTGRDGRPLNVIEMVYITGSTTDYDADGIPNATDSCPTTYNSGVDTDHNGIDDVCDTTAAVTTVPESDDTAGSAHNITAPHDIPLPVAAAPATQKLVAQAAMTPAATTASSPTGAGPKKPPVARIKTVTWNPPRPWQWSFKLLRQSTVPLIGLLLITGMFVALRWRSNRFRTL